MPAGKIDEIGDKESILMTKSHVFNIFTDKKSLIGIFHGVRVHLY